MIVFCTGLSCGQESVKLPSPLESSEPFLVHALPTPLIVSVLPFEDRTRRPDLAWLRRGVPDMLVTALVNNPALIVAERARVEEIMREHAFQLSGHVPDESAVRIGRLAGATVLVAGSIAVAGSLLHLHAQLIEVERGIVLGATEAEGALDDVPSVVKRFITDLAARLPGSGGRIVQDRQISWADTVRAAEANGRGEALSREGKLYQALEEYERALTADPHYPFAQSNYAGAVRRLSDAGLAVTVGRADIEHTVGRAVTRLTEGSIELMTGTPEYEEEPGGRRKLLIPVTLRLMPQLVETLSQAVLPLGGKTLPGSPGGRNLAILLSARSDINALFAKRLSEPRRVYARLLGRDGRTIAVYSRLRAWDFRRWVSPTDGEQVRLDADLAHQTKIEISGLPPEQAMAIVAMRTTIDAVPQEQATVRVEIDAVPDSTGLGRLPMRSSAGGQTESAAVHAILERLWDPPIVERLWAPGYVPGNERVAVVMSVIRRNKLEVVEEPRLLRPSGEPGFDSAALAATRAALAEWLADRAARPPHADDTDQGEIVKLRVLFRLKKDVPKLNLIIASSHTQSLTVRPPTIR